MGIKRRGHYCKICGKTRPNDKFSGKGHRHHLCKDCKRKGKKAYEPSTAEYDREEYYLSKAIRNCMILYTYRLSFFLFEFQRERYITRDDFESEIFVYQENAVQRFIVDESLQMKKALLDVLLKKYDETMDSGHIVEYNDILENECLEISKKRKQHLEVITSLKNLT